MQFDPENRDNNSEICQSLDPTCVASIKNGTITLDFAMRGLSSELVRQVPPLSEGFSEWYLRGGFAEVLEEGFQSIVARAEHAQRGLKRCKTGISHKGLSSIQRVCSAELYY